VWLNITFSREDALAHAVGENYVFMAVRADVIEGHFEIHETDLRDNLGIVMADGDEAEVVAGLTNSAGKVHAYITEHFTMSPDDGAPYAIGFGETKLFVLTSLGRFAQYHFRIPITSVPDVLHFDHRMLYEKSRLHQAIIVVTYTDFP
jgi:hypothetical protein